MSEFQQNRKTNMGTLNCKDVTKNFVHAHLYKMAMSDWVLVYMEYNT